MEKENKLRLKAATEKLIQAETDLRVKDKYIDQLREQNDEFKSNLEKIGFETFLQLKNELFAKEQEMDALAMTKQYLPVYDDITKEVDQMVMKYKQ